MSHVDEIYKGMIRLILEQGDRVANRTGIDTLSVFGHQERFDLREGFPLLTTKKMHTKSIFIELLWFLKGITDNQWLNDRGVTIWDEWRMPYTLDREVEFVEPRRPVEDAEYHGDFSLDGYGFLSDKDSEEAKLASLWVKMMKRCYDPNHHRYAMYGGCGATVNPRWHDVANFVDDARQLPHWWYKQHDWNSFELDKDYYGACQYGPETSVWLRTDENNKYMKTAKPITVTKPDGEANTYLTINEAADAIGIPLSTIARWLDTPPTIIKGANKRFLGWDFSEADLDGKLMRLALIPNGEHGKIYGSQWRRFGPNNVDQIASVFNDLKNNLMSRRIIVTGWNPEEADQVALPPCHTMWQVKAYPRKEGGHWLDLQLYQRSADLGLGVPYNIASYSALMHLLCHLSPADLHPRYFIHTYGDLHIYENHVDALKGQLDREPYAMPQFGISPDWAGMEMEAIDGVKSGNPDHEAGSDMKWQDLVITGYESHPRIKMDVAV